MKKVLFILCFICTPTVLIAADCDGGYIILGKDNQHEYCISQPAMTWWAGFAWCQNQGRQMASLSQACDGFSSTDKTQQCSNLVITHEKLKNSFVWTSSSPRESADYAYAITIGTGQFVQQIRTNGAIRVICN